MLDKSRRGFGTSEKVPSEETKDTESGESNGGLQHVFPHIDQEHCRPRGNW